MVSPASLALLRVMRRVREAGLKVMFDGQGADEAFAGYDRQLFPPALRSAAAGGDWRSVLAMLGGLDRRRAAWLARDLAPPLAHRLYRRAIGVEGVLDPDFVAAGEAVSEPVAAAPYGDPLTDALWRLHRRTSLPALLHYGDAISMACSVEYRAPFLDYRLVELAFRLPAAAKMGAGGTKVALRQALAGLLDDRVRLDPVKIGFHTPLARWLAENPGEMAEIAASSRLAAHGVFRPGALARALRRTAVGDARLESHAVRWLGAALWIEECIDTA
jgi:asparagine synthase (glutamine-hydrolysing)